ncbi:hypothetical protein ACFOTA_21840 [Chitinophaga sp. GCM10012297]|uniref:Fimbrillin-like n=1 Tax=Chitinophaga chungangae TaxID=2821488 RepID=A0ABS3YJK1_9BACT|nr:hypothetical protein [Chitinophaga chungangae]MBO9154872.1 hypothetical protein [Chitinophaga chungangae]
MKTKIMLAAAVLAAFVSCQKNAEQLPGEKQPVKMKEITLSLKGLDVSETPLGRKAPGDETYQRLLRDSTVYMVRVGFWSSGTSTSYGGAFTNPNNIRIAIPETGNVTLIAYALKRGSGGGLHYSWVAGMPYFDTPPIFDTLQNRMEIAPIWWQHYSDSLSNYKITKLQDTLSYTQYEYPEIDAYVADTFFSVSPVVSQLVLELKRASFGVEFSSPNFTAGQLKVSFAGIMEPKVLTPASIGGRRFLHTSQYYREEGWWHPLVPVKVVWEPGDGSQVIIGEKHIDFKRNTLTKINVTLPDPVLGIVPVLTDTAWGGNEAVDF